jgi:hypothetical protein
LSLTEFIWMSETFMGGGSGAEGAKGVANR